MSTSVTISGSTYLIPEQGESPPWGDDLNSLLSAMVEVLNTLSSSTDINTTSFTVANNVAVATNIPGASWDTSTVRSFILNYSIYRSTASTELAETGQLFGVYKSTAGSWDLAQTYSGSSGVTLSITPSGQLTYTSTSLAGGSYIGKMKFNSKTFVQT